MESLHPDSFTVCDETPVTALEPIMPHCAVMLVLDTSHSMYKGTALADLHRSLGAFVGAIGANAFRGAAVDVAAVGMGDDLRVLDDFHPFASSRLGSMRIRPKGDSPLGGALRLALGNNNDFVLLVGILIRCLIVGHELHRRVGRSPVDDEVLHVVATLRRHAVERPFQHFFGVVCAGDNRKFYHFCKIFW